MSFNIRSQHFLIPAIDVIDNCIVSHRSNACFSVSALLRRRAQLLGNLSSLMIQVLMKAFQQWCSHYPLRRRLACHAAKSGGPIGTTLYESFILEMLDSGMDNLFMQYPVLARNLGQFMSQQVLLECFQDRLCNDGQLIWDWLDLEVDAQIVDIDLNLSDPHDGGSVVCGLSFSNFGQKVFYKPRSLRPEWIFNRSLKWLEDQGLDLGIHTPQALLRDGYGWSLQARHENMSTLNHAETYATRAGSILALSHLLSATDLHADNIIASTVGPVVVDLETIFMPELLLSP